VKVNAKTNVPAVVRLTSEVSDRLAYNAARSTQARLRRTAPKKTGALAASFFITKIKHGSVSAYSIHTALDYANYQNKGTGPIHAKPGGVLRFEAGGSIVFAKSTRGVPATHFMDNAFNAITMADFVT
jgi:hypothetical protein